MLIYHIDRNGGRWVFNVPDCTKAQAGAFARVLRDISRINIRRREKLADFSTVWD